MIGGQAVRRFAPYRPSRELDFGIDQPANLDDFVDHLARLGRVEIQERGPGTVHLLWDGIKVSAFVLTLLVRHVEDRHLDVTGVLATKLHAILDRGLRRDFFDLYVMLQQQRLGIASVLAAIRRVYQEALDDGLMLRALPYFDDAEREPPLPGEGDSDWSAVIGLLPGAGREPTDASDGTAGDPDPERGRERSLNRPLVSVPRLSVPVTMCSTSGSPTRWPERP